MRGRGCVGRQSTEGEGRRCSVLLAQQDACCSASSCALTEARTQAGRWTCVMHFPRCPRRLASPPPRTASALLLVALVAGSAAASCPSVCNCKWKGGKQTVECGDRGLITVPTNVHPETQVLDMSENNLQILPRDLFVRAGLLDLQKVFLRHCRIGEIDDHAFRGLSNLVEMDLSDNLLTSVPSTTFRDVQFLREVILTSNPIQKIEDKAFANLPNIEKLDLSNCEIETISERAFEGAEQLGSLKLNGNRLTELQQATLESLSGLHGVELHDNPWLCDCRMRAAKLWLARPDAKLWLPAAPRCHGGPARLAGRSIAELDADELACKPQLRSPRRAVEASAGADAALECRVYAVPAAAVAWYRDGRRLANGSAADTRRRFWLFERGGFDKRSTLVLPDAQEADSGRFVCAGENRAGALEADFTLRVRAYAAGDGEGEGGSAWVAMGGARAAGLGGALAACALLVLLAVLARFRLRARGRSPVPQDKGSARGPSAPSAPASAPSAPAADPDSAPVPAAANPDLIKDAPAPTDLDAASPDAFERAAASAARFNYDTSDKAPIICDGGASEDDAERVPPAPEGYPPDFGLPIHGAGTGARTPSAKTLRVWQRGVPVLPPVTSLKRVLTAHSSHSSPDEGYQEGCGTDV